MLTPRPHWLAALALLACSTEHRDGGPLFQKINTSDPTLVWLASAMPAQVGAVRIKVNGSSSSGTSAGTMATPTHLTSTSRAECISSR